MLFASCVKNDIVEPIEADGALAAVEVQAMAVEASVEQLNSLQELVEPYGVDLTAASESMKAHTDALAAGMSLGEGSLATLELQSELAAMIGSAEAELYKADALDSDAKKQFVSFENSVRGWLGGLFVENYSASVAKAKVEAVVVEFSQNIKEQELYVEALVSDIEAGLREDSNPSELTKLSADLNSSSKEAEMFNENIAATAADVNAKYTAAIKAAVADPASVELADIKALNEAAGSELKNVDNILEGLAAEIAQCKTKLEELQKRLEVLEDSIEGLLDLIQSVTFLSERSDENAVAYYSMDVNTKVSDENLPYYGKAKRTAAGTMELNYIVRPAAAATALNANLDAVSVMGYYANSIALMGVDPTKYVDFEVTKVVATDANSGLVTVTVTPNLKEEFYYKEIGAKCALSIKTGKTDITSKFVEIVPMDNSAEVYVTSITPSEKYIEISKGETFTLSAAVLPEKATNKAYSMAASDSRIVSYDPNTGIFTAAAAGETVVTVTSHGTDEWGLPLVAECKVKVNEAFRLSGPPYVEVGYTADLFLDYPASAIVESKVWKSSDTSKATVDQSGKVTGVWDTYLLSENDYGDVTISCTINGVTTVSHSLKVVVAQPKSINVPTLADNQNSITIKVDQKLSLAATILPESVNPEYFRLYYSSDQGLGWINSSTGWINEHENQLNPCTAWVYIDVKDMDKSHYFAPGASLRRTVIVKVEPYYIASIKLDDIKMEPGQTASLTPVFTSDVTGKAPTNTTLSWQSDNESVATVDQHGVVTSLSEGRVTITATSTDGSNVSGKCVVDIVAPWKAFELGDYVVRTSNGDVDFASDYNSARSKGSVVGVVIAKTNPRATDRLLPESCTHGIAIALGEGEGKWWSGAPSSSPYKVCEWAVENGYQSTMGVDWSSSAGTHRAGTGDKFVGYNNTLALKAFLSAKGLSSEMINALNAYNGPALPNGASQYYLPSVAEMDAVAAVSNNSLALSDKLSTAGGTKFTNAAYWTSSDSGNSSSNAAKINPLTGALDGAGMKTNAAKFRYVFAF